MFNTPDDAIKCLDKGFVRLVDSMGGDDAIQFNLSFDPLIKWIEGVWVAYDRRRVDSGRPTTHLTNALKSSCL